MVPLGMDIWNIGCKMEKENIAHIIGQHIENLRKSKNIKQNILIDKTGLNRSYVYKIEAGICLPSIITIDAIINALDITYEEFYTEDIKNKLKEISEKKSQ